MKSMPGRTALFPERKLPLPSYSTSSRRSETSFRLNWVLSELTGPQVSQAPLAGGLGPGGTQARTLMVPHPPLSTCCLAFQLPLSSPLSPEVLRKVTTRIATNKQTKTSK